MKPCINCGTEVWRYARFHLSVTACSVECLSEARRKGLVKHAKPKRATRLYKKGPENPLWIGSIWRGGIYYGANWKTARIAARMRDHNTCQHCGVVGPAGRSLDVHHIIRFLDFDRCEDANALSNLITLCKPCHKKADMEQRSRRNDIDPITKYGPKLKPRTRPRYKTFGEVACFLARNWLLVTTSPEVDGEDPRNLGHAICRAAAELLASGDHKRIVAAERTHYLDWANPDPDLIVSWFDEIKSNRLKPATRRAWSST